MSNAAPTRRPQSLSAVVTPDAVDAFMARALVGRASYAELLVLAAIADREVRRSDVRVTEGGAL